MMWGTNGEGVPLGVGATDTPDLGYPGLTLFPVNTAGFCPCYTSPSATTE